MAQKIGLTDDTLYTNHEMRIPVMICVDRCTNKKRALDDMQRSIQKLQNEIFDRSDLRNKVDLGIIAFAEEAEVYRPIGTLSIHSKNDGRPLTLSSATPDLGKALKLCYTCIRRRMSEYGASNIGYYNPFVLIFSTGRTADEAQYESMASFFKQQDSMRRMTVAPVLMDNGDGKRLKMLNYEGVVLSHDNNMEDLFKQIGKSIEKLSESSENIYENVLNKGDWERFKK